MKISVVIPVKDGENCLSECLLAIKQQQKLKFNQDFEIIVVDDGSNDNTAQIARGCGAKVISQPNAGPASARNSGVKNASGDLIAFTDADCVPAPDWLYQITLPFENPKVMGVKGAYRTRERNWVARFVQLEYESKYERMRQKERIDFIDTYSAAYRRKVFLENGGFNEFFPFPSVEDQEFSFRLAHKGYWLVFQPDAVVYHHHDLTLQEYANRKFGIGYWKAVMLNWLPEKGFSDSHTPPSQRWQILILGMMILSAISGLFFPPALLLALVSFLLFVVTAIPLLARIAHDDPPILSIGLGMILIRAAALGSAIAAGFLFSPKNTGCRQNGLNLIQRMVKRMIDLTGAALGCVLSAPILLIACAAIKLDSPGPAWFVQLRAGENGRPFKVYKLRTMVNGAEQKLDEVMENNSLKGPVFKIPNDQRVTRVGKFLRRWSLDELPQFLNVLKGDMSLVGPRPEETWLVEKYDDTQRQRLLVKPGMTGPMQIGGRGRLDMDERLGLELKYIKNYSIWKDIQIIAHSIPAIIKGDGAF